MTLRICEATYTAGLTLTAWPSGSTSNEVAMTEIVDGLYRATLDDSIDSLWYVFSGTSDPTTWDPMASGGPLFAMDLGEGTPVGSSIVFTGNQVERVSGTTIVVFKDEDTPVTVTLTEGSFTGLTLQFAVEDKQGTDVLVIENASITRTSTTFTVTIPDTLTSRLNNYSWAMRDITSGANAVLMHGVLSVRYAAGKDA